ncbi:MAG: terpene cyclase/mutase family protein [Oscillospiraceae bacterium]|nr:terpene cyclase/mutase family protein [Oscillospiraceae bacterium]
MTKLRIRAGSFLLSLMMLFLTPAMTVSAAGSNEKPVEKFPVAISIFENITHSYLAGPLTLQCPEGSTPADVLQQLCDYAYLDEVSLEEDRLVSVTAENSTYTAVDGESGWVLTVNGQELASDEPFELKEAASFDWIYWVTDEARDVTVSGEYAVQSVSVHQSVWKPEYSDKLKEACGWLKTNGRGAPSLFVLGSAGVSVEHKYLTSILRQIAQSTPADGAELAEYILAVSFSGISAVNVSGRDLIAELSEFPDISRQHAALALLAADCNGYELPEGTTNDRSGLLNVILAAQNEDGSFSSVRGETGNITMTALSLTAMAPYSAEQTVMQAIDLGISYLASQRDPVSGGYLNEKNKPDITSTALVITALSSLGVRLDDERFMNEGGTDLLALLLTMQQDGGGFAASPDGEPTANVTEAAILAMMAQKTGRSPYLLRSPIIGEGSPELSLPEPEPESSEEVIVEPEPEPISRLSIIFGAVGLAIGILLGSLALFMAVKLMNKADKLDAEDKKK